MGGGRGAAATHQAAADILAAFLTGPLTGVATDLPATVARYPEVLGGAVAHKPAGVVSAASHSRLGHANTGPSLLLSLMPEAALEPSVPVRCDTDWTSR